MKELLKKLDFPGASCEFQMKKQRNFYSWQGGLIMTVFYAFSIYYIFHETKSFVTFLYTSKSFQFVHSLKPELNLRDYEDFMITFCNRNEGNSSNSDPIINEAINETLEWSYIARKPWNMKGSINIPLKQCQINNFPQGTINKDTFKNYENCKCVDVNDLRRFNISFSNEDSYSTYLTYQLKFKDDIYQNQTSYNYYYNYIKNSSAKNYIFFLDSTVDFKDYSNDFFNYFMNNLQKSYLNPDIYSISDNFLNEIEIKINDSYFFNDRKNLFN